MSTENKLTITQDTLLQIDNIIKSSKLLDISEILITKDQVKGINFDKTGFMLSTLELPDDFPAMGINRTDVYNSRFNLIKDIDGYKVTGFIKDAPEPYVEKFKFNSKSLKIEFRCCMPALIKAPGSINDEDKYFITFTEEDVKTLLKASASMDTLNIKIIGNQEGLSYELKDLSNDIVEINSDSQVECDDTDFNFNFNYVQKPFLNLLRNCNTFEFALSNKGILNIKVNNINFYLLPQLEK